MKERSTQELLKLLKISSLEELDEGKELSVQEEENLSEGEKDSSKSAGKKEKAPSYIQAQYPGIAPWNESPPRAFVPPNPPPYPFDPQDSLMPQSGFIRDFAYSLKGRESPPIFNIFGALFTLSALNARKAWFEWADEVVFPNLYVLWIAPPAICKKGTAIGRSMKLIQQLPRVVADDPVMFDEKSLEIVTSKATSEGLYIALEKKNKTYLLPDGTFHQESFGSRAVVAAPEFVTFMNNKKYNVGLVDTITNLYDCPDIDQEFTRGRGKKTYGDFYLCLGGALTPMHLQRSIPEEAFAGGFMSRCILVVQETPTSLYHKPILYAGFPTVPELLRKLRWVLYKARGAYRFTEEAEKYIEDWYYPWKKGLISKGLDDESLGELRFDMVMRRIALLIRMGEYREGHDITKENVEDSFKLLNYTYSMQSRATNLVGAKEVKRHYVTLANYVKAQKSVSRRKLLNRMQNNSCYAKEVSDIIMQLRQQGLIRIELDEHENSCPTSEGREIYTWIGPIEDETTGVLK